MNIKNFSTVTGLFLGVFVVGVDSFIISPLLPQIAQDFRVRTLLVKLPLVSQRMPFVK